jgi:hypothetical protein
MHLPRYQFVVVRGFVLFTSLSYLGTFATLHSYHISVQSSAFT